MIQTISSSIGKKSTKSCLNWHVAKWLGCGVFAIAVASAPNIALAINIKDVPNPKQVQGGWVADTANILSLETEEQIDRSLSKLAATNGSEVAVVTVQETAPAATPKQFATDLFNYWGIGKKGEDNGVLLLISTKDRRVEIETGYGVEDVLPDALVGNIIREKITPQFKQGNFDKGTLAGTQALVAVLEQKVRSVNSINSNQPEQSDRQKEQEVKKFNYLNVSQIEQSDRQNWQLLYWLLGLGSITGMVAIYFKIRATQKTDEIIVNPCSTCHQAMTKVDATVLKPMLSKPQQVAQELGSVDFEAWHCTNCQPQPSNLKDVNLSRKVCYHSDFRCCPSCDELIVERTSKVLQPATVESEGKKLVIDTCHCCSYQEQTEKTINRLSPPPAPASRNIWSDSSSSSGSNWISSSGSGSSSSGSDWSSGSSGGYSGGSDWSSGSSGGYSGGGDWGGGSSGGGGAGGSW